MIWVLVCDAKFGRTGILCLSLNKPRCRNEKCMKLMVILGYVRGNMDMEFKTEQRLMVIGIVGTGRIRF